MNKELKKRLRRKTRVRSRLNPKGWPRLSVFRSNKHIYGQIIDDKLRKTLVSASDYDLKTNGDEKPPKSERAGLVGEILAKRALKKGISKIVFDRGFLKYHGRIKALAWGARKGGLKF